MNTMNNQNFVMAQKKKQPDYKSIDMIKTFMLRDNITLEDLKQFVPNKPTTANQIEKLAGVWKNTKIDPLQYQRNSRKELS